jgi:hypothetical protein
MKDGLAKKYGLDFDTHVKKFKVTNPSRVSRCIACICTCADACRPRKASSNKTL